MSRSLRKVSWSEGDWHVLYDEDGKLIICGHSFINADHFIKLGHNVEEYEVDDEDGLYDDVATWDEFVELTAGCLTRFS